LEIAIINDKKSMVMTKINDNDKKSMVMAKINGKINGNSNDKNQWQCSNSMKTIKIQK
jgi:hypothetical protein